MSTRSDKHWWRVTRQDGEMIYRHMTLENMEKVSNVAREINHWCSHECTGSLPQFKAGSLVEVEPDCGSRYCTAHGETPDPAYGACS